MQRLKVKALGVSSWTASANSHIACCVVQESAYIMSLWGELFLMWWRRDAVSCGTRVQYIFFFEFLEDTWCDACVWVHLRSSFFDVATDFVHLATYHHWFIFIRMGTEAKYWYVGISAICAMWSSCWAIHRVMFLTAAYTWRGSSIGGCHVT